jgi:hypothetical protein
VYLEAGMSDELRAAAERLLALAGKASAGPWKCNVDVFDEGQDIQVCVQDDAIRSLFCADSGIRPTAEVSWADAKLTQTYRDGEFVAAACTLAPQIARACLVEHPEPPALTRDGVEALRRAAGEIDVDAVREFRGEHPADDGEAARLRARLAEVEAERDRLRAAVKGHEADGHLYGSRPCATCATVTKALGEPFGCDLFRLQKALARR